MVNNIESLIGERFGRLIVIGEVGRTKRMQRLWLCKCDCGNTKILTTGVLKNGAVKSCGCLRSEMVSNKNYRHGMSETKIYKTWKSMKYRCFNSNADEYERYGGRGITICKDWLIFENFCNWAMQNGYDDSLTIDRIDNDGNYEPNNCRWISLRKQMRNKSINRKLTYKGETKCLIEWAEYFEINPSTIRTRIDRYGWPVEKALETPARIKRKDAI